MRWSIALCALATLSACSREREPAGISLIPDAAPWAGEGRCRAQAETAAYRGRGPAPFYPLYPGDGVYGLCLGDQRSESDCRSREDYCRLDSLGYDLYFDANDRVAKIRAHRARRGGTWPWIGPRPRAPNGIVLGMRVSELPPGLEGPRSKERRVDPEFGELEIWHYPGMDVEIESHRGERLVGGMWVLPK